MLSLRERIHNPEFKARHRRAPTAFTRNRKLSFVRLLLSLLRKSAKSLQNVLNELHWLADWPLLSASAFSQARAQLKHTAYIELNRELLLPFVWANEPQRYQGFRLLAGDSTCLRLPLHPSVREQFGVIATYNGRDATVSGEYGAGQAFVLYDLLNQVVLDAQLTRAHSYEVKLAEQALVHSDAHDLLIFDRGFAAYEFLAVLQQRQRQFVIRCSCGSFAAVQALFVADQETSQQVTLQAPQAQRAALSQAGLPLSLRLRLVSVRLATGELEVLVTSLLDEQRYPSSTFKHIYHQRWGVETLFDRLKNRLALENFSGQTATAILQDFHASIFVTNLESLLTQTAAAQLAERAAENQLGQSVNKMVSFHALKLQVFALLDSAQEPAVVLEQLTQLLLRNPTYTGRKRDVPRRKTQLSAALHYQKRVRKHCF